MSVFAYTLVFLLSGIVAAHIDNRKGRLLSHKSGAVIWTVTAVFFVAFLFFAVAGTPPAWVPLFISIGYHIAASYFLSKRHKQATQHTHS